MRLAARLQQAQQLAQRRPYIRWMERQHDELLVVLAWPSGRMIGVRLELASPGQWYEQLAFTESRP